MSGVRWPCATRYPCTTEPNRRGVSLHLSLRVKTSRTAPDNGAFLNQGAPSEEEDHPGHGKILETVSFIKAAHAPPYNTKPVVGGVGIKPLSLYPGLFFHRRHVAPCLSGEEYRLGRPCTGRSRASLGVGPCNAAVSMTPQHINRQQVGNSIVGRFGG